MDEFDSVPLATSVRRAVRIANLLGDSRTAIRLNLELTGRGRGREANGEDIRRWLRETEDVSDPTGPAEQAVTEYLGDRDMGDGSGKVMVHSLAELEFWDANRPDVSAMAKPQYELDLAFRTKRVEILDTVRSRVFTRLCSWERQLGFAAQNDNALMRSQLRVDGVLAENAPDVLRQFNAVSRRLAEVSEATTEMDIDELLSQAVTSCRRILKAVVDAVQPVDPVVKKTSDGRALTDDAYKNRLFEFIKNIVGSESYSSALSATTEGLYARFEAIDKLTNKGVHAAVAQYEAEFCALNTYVLAGEIIRLSSVPRTELQAAADASEKPYARKLTCSVSPER